MSGAIIPPRPIPDIAIPTAIPRFFVNHLGRVDIIGITEKPKPIPIRIPQIKYTCHNALICDSNKKATPVKRPPIVTKRRGPYLSLSLPLRIPRPPPTIKFKEIAADRAPLSQPNSAVIGFKNTPKLCNGNERAARIPMQITTITQP
jgi:hypothetical protein